MHSRNLYASAERRARGSINAREREEEKEREEARNFAEVFVLAVSALSSSGSRGRDELDGSRVLLARGIAFYC